LAVLLGGSLLREWPVKSAPRLSPTFSNVTNAAFFEPPGVPEGNIDAAPLVLAPHQPDEAKEEIALVKLPDVQQSDDNTTVATESEQGPALLPPQSWSDEAFTELVELPSAEAPTDAAAAPDALAEMAEPEAPNQEVVNPAPAESAPAVQKPPAVPAAPNPISGEPEALTKESLEPETTLADASPVATGSLTGAMVAERAQAKIRHGNQLAQRGANFAARNEFIQVLRMIAEAKDQKHGAARRTIALANGLRALEEAADFVPHGPELDADVNVAVIVSSHRTPVGRTPEAEGLMPQQLADLYFAYAQSELGASVAGEPAGSMALYALGKLYSQLGRVESEKYLQADRCAFALQHAALLARDDNHLAAHELGVLLAESGHFVESEYLLSQVAAKQPHPVVFRNLARVQRKLGREQLAAASEQQAQFLAGRDAAQSGNIVWVSPQVLAQTSDALTPSTTPAPITAQPSPTQPRPAATEVVRAPVRNVSRLPGGWMR
jgi:hypothetical protein